MSLIQTLRDAQLDRRRTARLNPADKLMATALGTVIGEATRNTRNINAPTDEEVLRALRKIVSGIEELQSHVYTEDRAIEVRFLSQWIPQTLTECQIVDALHALPDDYEIYMKGMKAIKTALEDKYPGQVDGAMLAKVVKEWGTN